MKPIKTIIQESVNELSAKIQLADFLWPDNTMTPEEKILHVTQFISTEFPGQNAPTVLNIVSDEMQDIENGDDLPDDLKGRGYENDLRNLGH